MQNCYDLATADVSRAEVTSDQIAHVIMRYQSTPGVNGGSAGGIGQDSSGLELAAILAGIFKKQVPVNCRYNVYSYYAQISGTGSLILQLVPQNLNRKFLRFDSNAIENNPVEDTRLLFQESSVTQQDIVAEQWASYQPQGVPCFQQDPTAHTNVSTPLVFSTPPTNAVSVLIRGNPDNFVQGILLEGV